LESYNPTAWKSIADYIGSFEAWVYEFNAIDDADYPEHFLRDQFLTNIGTDTDLKELIIHCKVNKFSFAESARYIKQYGLPVKKISENSKK